MDLLKPFYAARQRFRTWRALRARGRASDTVFIGITGSHGKSTATALLGAILARVGPTVSGLGYNTGPGVRRTVTEVGPRHRFCVQEVSGHQPGAIDQAFPLLRPSVGIVTGIGGDHRASFRTREATAAEKGKLVWKLPADGLAVLNADDPLVAGMAAGCSCRVVTYGRAETADLRLVEATSPWPERLTLDVAWRGERFSVPTRFVGTHWSVSAMAALLAALELGVPRADCLAAIAAFEPLFNRLSVHEAPNGAIYVLDGGKGSFSGIEAAMSFLGEVRAPRKTVVFGSVSDASGKDRTTYNRIARRAMAFADRAIFVGEKAPRVRRLAADEFAGRIEMIENFAEAAARLRADTLPGEVVFVKGAHGDHLERLVLAQLMRVDCWVQRCGKEIGCLACRRLPKRRAPASLRDPNRITVAG